MLLPAIQTVMLLLIDFLDVQGRVGSCKCLGIWRPVRKSNPCRRRERDQITVIHRNFAAWIALYRTSRLKGTDIGLLMDSRCRFGAALRNRTKSKSKILIVAGVNCVVQAACLLGLLFVSERRLFPLWLGYW